MIVLANGCFDPLHYGHVLHLEEAKKIGGQLFGNGVQLIVALTNDEQVSNEKGEGRPFMPANLRAEMLKALRCVDGVIIVDGPVTAFKLLRPNLFVKGMDYAGRVSAEVQKECAARGIKIAFTSTPKWSATSVGAELRSR